MNQIDLANDTYNMITVERPPLNKGQLRYNGHAGTQVPNEQFVYKTTYIYFYPSRSVSITFLSIYTVI